VHGHAERFHVAECLGQWVQPRGRPGEVALEASVAGGVAGEDEFPAQVRVAALAQVAAVARDGRVDRDADAVERAALDDAGHLVPADERAGDLGVADAALLVPVQVRPADPDRGDPHQALALGHLRHRILGQTQVVRAVEPCGEVAGRHRRSPVTSVRPLSSLPVRRRRPQRRSGGCGGRRVDATIRLR
jgi:hypothetical protein